MRNFRIMQLETKIHSILFVALVVTLSACNVTKFVPQGEYLLNDVKVKVADAKEVTQSDLMKYVQQKQNTEILGFWKLQLGVYNTAPKDSITGEIDTTKWTGRNAQKIGEAPVIYSQERTVASMHQLARAMQNKGYFDAVVDTNLSVEGQLLNLEYLISANRPYKIGVYSIDEAGFDTINEDLLRLARTSRYPIVSSGTQFDVDRLNEERQRVASAMRRVGYYYFNADYLRFVADSSKHSGEIDLQLQLYTPVYKLSREERERLFTQFYIDKVHFHMDYDEEHLPEDEEMFSSNDGRYVFTWVGEKLLRNRVLLRNCPIQPGSRYNERQLERAYTRMNQLAPVKYVDIRFEQVGDSLLDCHVVLSRNKLNSFSANFEGMYSAGDWGVACGVGYANRNIFRGAEQLSVDARTSYEWRQNGGRAIEAKASAQLQFPSDVKVDLAYNFQNRPDEYTRSIFNAGLQYRFRQNRVGLNHQFRFLDISYVYLPWISDAFRDQFLQSTNILKYSYENHFIVGIGYSGNYSSFRSGAPYRSYVSVNYNVETAGNLLRALAKPCQFEVDEQSGNYKLLNTQFSQFAKADFSVTYNHIFSPNHRLVWHADLGVAVPYGNSQTIPFEKRYFAGGSNSVRGWSARTLGPGGYKGNGDWIDFNNQSGDVRLNLNMEYRARVVSIFELAAFVDAGNIWTVFDYAAQPFGVFKWNEFYKQIALAYGVGVRLDLTFFVFRLDMGVKLYDPSRLYDGSHTQWRTVPNGLNWKQDFVLHFAIGYPF